MLYSKPAEEIARELLSGNAKEILIENDKIKLEASRTELVSKWPKSIIPVAEKNLSLMHSFTKMIGSTNEKFVLIYLRAYEYNAHKEFEVLQYVLDSYVQPKDPIVSQNMEEVLEGAEVESNSLQNTEKLELQSSKTRKIEFSPFLPNSENPFDRNANSKLLKQKFENIKVDGNRRNILSFIEESKKTDPEKSTLRYGQSAQKKSHTNNSIDINDILKYTLGVKREKEEGVKPEPIKNPFVRVPPKYYSTLGGFYAPTQ